MLLPFRVIPYASLLNLASPTSVENENGITPIVFYMEFRLIGGKNMAEGKSHLIIIANQYYIKFSVMYIS